MFCVGHDSISVMTLTFFAGSDEKSGGGGEDDVVDDARREEKKNNRRWPPRAEEERRERGPRYDTHLSRLVDGRKCETCCGERVAHPKARGMKLERGAITNAHDVEVEWTTGHWTCKDLGDMAAYVQQFLLSSPLAGFPRLAGCDIAPIVSDTQRV